MGALEDAREGAAMPRGVRPGASTAIHKIGQLLSISSTRATVSIDGSQGIDLPFLPGTYTGITTVWLLVNPLEGGRAVLVLGPAGTQASEDVPSAPVSPAGTVTATAVILPTWSGTWRVSRSAWDRWNTDRYGGRSDVYQGDAYGSGTMIGLATYGDQVVNLGASSITSAVLTVQRNGSGGSAVVTVQGTPAGTAPAGAPSPTGSTASSSSLSATGKGTIDVTSALAAGLAAGTVKSIALVGTTYAGVYGTSRADGMALALTYERPA